MKKVKHNPDYSKNKDADIIDKGNGSAIHQDHWLMDVGDSVFPRNTGSIATAYLPQCGYKRPTPHVKINECDH